MKHSQPTLLYSPRLLYIKPPSQSPHPPQPHPLPPQHRPKKAKRELYFTHLKMAFDSDTVALKKTTTKHVHSSATTTYHPPRRPRRKLSFFRRRKLPIVRLGGKPRFGFFLVKFVRRVKLKALKLKYLKMLKKLKEYYRSMAKDMIEGSGTMDSFQQRLLLETSFAVPVMGFSFNTVPKNYV